MAWLGKLMMMMRLKMSFLSIPDASCPRGGGGGDVYTQSSQSMVIVGCFANVSQGVLLSLVLTCAAMLM
jgi:hypothetical protein